MAAQQVNDIHGLISIIMVRVASNTNESLIFVIISGKGRFKYK